jgi:transcriptional regulator with XRE-family HTH domain
MTITEYDLDAESEVTPSDLKAMRLRLGLDMSELAHMLGLAGRRDVVENLEKGRTWTMHQAHADILEALQGAFYRRLDDIILGDEPPEVLIGFPNDGVFREYEPELAEELRFNSVHRMMLAQAQSALAENPQIVEIIPTRYQEWLNGRTDNQDEREAWALEHMKIYRIKPGLPTIGNREP